MSGTSTIKNYMQGAALLLFLVGLPLGSWYYLQAGFDYHKDLMSELKNYGRIPEFKLIDQNGKTLTRDDVAEKVMVVNFFDPKEPSYSKKMEYLRKLYSQFHDRTDLVFFSHALDSVTNLKTLAANEELDNKQNLFLTADQEHLLKVLSKGYQMPDLTKRAEDKTIPRSTTMLSLPKAYPYFILVDDSGTIRNYYDTNDEKSITRLVEHLALILPRKSEEKAQLKRETEK